MRSTRRWVFAYSQGMAKQKAIAAEFAEQAFATHALDNATALEGAVQLLTRSIERTEVLTKDELRDWLAKAARWRLNVEQIAVPYLRKRDKEDVANSFAELVREALALERELQV